MPDRFERAIALAGVLAVALWALGVAIVGGGHVGLPGGVSDRLRPRQYPSNRTSSRRSDAKKWMPSTKRTQRQRVHMTSECVRALSA
jgi:hypothetical protein